MGAGDLSAALWQERRELDLLLFTLETQRLHILAGNLHWLSFTASEVASVLDRLRFEALARSVESAAVAEDWGLPAQATLPELIAGAPAGPWQEILREHRDGLKDLLGRLAAEADAVDMVLRKVVLPAFTGAGAGEEGGAADGPHQLAMAANLERALIIVQRTPQPLLEQYLDGGHGR